jgi:2-methylisocitrate lyase-like PEP mutase family enzyme
LGDTPQDQDNIENFCKKISIGKNSQVTEDFMIIARIESFIQNAGLEDAIKRAKAYIDAGADGIMIHSKKKEPWEIFEFCKEFSKFEVKVPLIVVPTTYNAVYEGELSAMGVNLVIYANHMLRSAYPAMVNTVNTILKHGRLYEAEKYCFPINEFINLIPEN